MLDSRLQLAEAEQARRILATRRAIDFTELTYPRYITEPFHRKVGEALDAITTGDIKRLMIFAPPQHGKSELVSVRLPGYWLGKNPDLPVILTSYGGSLAFRNSRSARAVVESIEYQQIFPHIKTDRTSRAVDNWKIEGYKGFCVAAGVGGPITGHGAGLGIIDDPIQNWAQAQSDTQRENIWDWWRGTFRTRIWEGGSIVLIMTRWHEDDIAGRLLSGRTKNDWEVLHFPAIADYEGDPIDRKLGEPLCPNRYSKKELEAIEGDVGPLVWISEYQGRPAPLEGDFFKINKINYLDKPELPYDRLARFWDLAATEEKQGRDPDYTVGALLGKKGNWIDVIDIERGRWGTQMVEQKVLATARRDKIIYGDNVTIGIEREPGASGKHLVHHFITLLAGHNAIELPASGSKMVRAQPFSAQVNIGNVRMVIADWNTPAVSEMRYFPAGRHDDIVDASSGAFTVLTEEKQWKENIEFAQLGKSYGKK